MRFVETLTAVEMVEDWSKCRSIPRAMRRRKQGHKQHDKMFAKPCAYKIDGVIHIHPALYAELRLHTEKTQHQDAYDVPSNWPLHMASFYKERQPSGFMIYAPYGMQMRTNSILKLDITCLT